jgi:lipoyl(octanoyl) transferase
MAIDLALHDRAARTGEGFLRFYRWEPSCLSFGRHEPARRRYDRGRIEAMGMDAVRRPTGGRAVWHARELTYAVAAPDTSMGTLREAYHRIHETIALALRRLGAPVQLAPQPHVATPVDAGSCFAAAAGGEVVHIEQKVAGSAQLRSGGAFLQHGSVLLEDDQSRIVEVSRSGAASPAVVALSHLLGRPVPWSEVADGIAGAARAWGPDWAELVNTDTVLDSAEVFAPGFRDPAWTWQR